MRLSARAQGAQESVTLKINERVQKLSESGRLIYNMTAGQLPFKPLPEFIHTISTELNFLKSYQYSPITGFNELQKKLTSHMAQNRHLDIGLFDDDFGCIVSNGSKHTIYNILGAILNPGDEVIILTPYWVSYPEMIKFWGGVASVVKSHAFDAYTPHLEDIKKAMSSRTKAIIINSPNNPAGIHYSDEWMRSFADFMLGHPEVLIISDELYSELYYFDPKPSYFYQFKPELLKQTVIVDGISKSFACTGLRIGYCLGPLKLIDAMAKIQSQTTSGASSLIQKALIDFDFSLLKHFLDPVKVQLRDCAQIVREEFRKASLPHCWYQTNSAFYYMIDFSRTPIFEKYKNLNEEDHSERICTDILEKTGVALVPGTAFGYPHSARMSMTLEVGPFREGLIKLVEYISQTK